VAEQFDGDQLGVAALGLGPGRRGIRIAPWLGSQVRDALRARGSVGAVAGTARPEEPDFAALYDTEESASPRMAAVLWATARMLADLYSDDEMWDDLRDQLPKLAQRLADDVWMKRFVHCFEAIATRLAAGHPDAVRLAICTGEEMALHLIIDFAESARAGLRLLMRCGASTSCTTPPEDGSDGETRGWRVVPPAGGR
jgi:hypothetical protein